MNIAGEITVAAPREAVFKALSDAPFFASCIEGVQDLKQIDATRYDAVLETRIAYMRFKFKVVVKMTKLLPPEAIEAKVEGTPLGVVGRLTATATTQLAEAGAGTVIRYAVEATLTGKLGSMGQPVLKAKAKEMEKQFSERLAAAFAGGSEVVTPFELSEPATLKEAIALIDPDDPEVRPIAGGTALMLMMKAGVFRPRRLVSLRKLGDKFTRIAAAPSGELTIGALAPLSALEHSPEVARNAPVIVRAMKRLSNVRVRNVATVGGALAHGDPHMDLPPVLIALNASVAIAGPKGERILPVEDLLTGYYETALARNELITELRIPAQGPAQSVYFKVTAGSADDWPALGVAVTLAAEGARVKSARIVVSAATVKAMRLKSAEQALIGADANDKTLAKVAEAAASEADIIADLRGSASYKRELLRVYAARAVRAAMGAS